MRLPCQETEKGLGRGGGESVCVGGGGVVVSGEFCGGVRGLVGEGGRDFSDPNSC